MSEDDGGDSSGSSTNSVTDTGADGEVSPRMFGKFHYEADHVGYMNPVEPEGITLYAWASMQIDRDGSLSVRTRICEGAGTLRRFTWVNVGGDVLQVVPEELMDDGTFEFFADPVTAVTLSPGPGCDDIEVVIEHPLESGRPNYTERWLPGELCAEGKGDDCDFVFVWCDGAPPPACEEQN